MTKDYGMIQHPHSTVIFYLSTDVGAGCHAQSRACLPWGHLMPSLNIRSHDAPMNSSFIMQLRLFTGSVLYGFIRHGLVIIFCSLSVFMNSVTEVHSFCVFNC